MLFLGANLQYPHYPTDSTYALQSFHTVCFTSEVRSKKKKKNPIAKKPHLNNLFLYFFVFVLDRRGKKGKNLSENQRFPSLNSREILPKSCTQKKPTQNLKQILKTPNQTQNTPGRQNIATNFKTASNILHNLKRIPHYSPKFTLKTGSGFCPRFPE